MNLSDSAITLNKTISPVISLSMENPVRPSHPVFLRSPLVTSINSNQTSASDSTTVKTRMQNIRQRRDGERIALTQRMMGTEVVTRTPEPTALVQHNMTHIHTMTGSWCLPTQGNNLPSL